MKYKIGDEVTWEGTVTSFEKDVFGDTWEGTVTSFESDYDGPLLPIIKVLED